jgi:hypothetical protein
MPEITRPVKHLSRAQWVAINEILINHGDLDKDDLLFYVTETERTQLVRWGYIRPDTGRNRYEITQEGRIAFDGR